MKFDRYRPFQLCLLFILAAVFSFSLTSMTLSQTSALPEQKQESKRIFIGLTCADYDTMTRYFLRTIEHLDYDKKLITLHINMLNTNEDVQKEVLAWKEENQDLYEAVIYADSSALLGANPPKEKFHHLLAKIQDGYLDKAAQLKSDYCLISTSDAFLAPLTLKYLVQKDKPVITPMLRPIPLAGDPYRNFFGNVTETGYYHPHPDYELISTRQKIGTFNVPCVLKTYLIKAPYFASLSFSQDYSGFEFITFCNNARKKNIGLYLCNEKEFGFEMHWDGSSAQERQDFTLKNADLEVNPEVLNAVLLPYYEQDAGLKKYVQNFKYEDYLIFRVQNKTLFYLDGIFDAIKSYFLKKGYYWEEAFQEQFEKYITPGSIALDIGAHIGTHVLRMSALVGDKGSVYAFEPQKKLFTELAINLYLNDIKNVKLQHKALGNEHKFIQIQVPDEGLNVNRSKELQNIINEGHGTVFDVTDEAKEKTELVRLDDYNLSGVSFIKMDVEGFEMEVIKGGQETILRNKPVMIIEIFDTPETKERLAFIESLGYVSINLCGYDYLFLPIEKLGLVDKPFIPLSDMQDMEGKDEKQAPTEKEDPLVVAWEGTFLDFGSLSNVNRYFTEQLERDPQVALFRIAKDFILKCLENEKLQNSSPKLCIEAQHNTQVTIRHAWPPNWIAPLYGKWVLIQPWEFGSLPKEWVEQIKRVDEVWAPSTYVKNVYVDSGVPAEKVFVVPNGVDPAKFHPKVTPYKLETKKNFKFLFLGGTIARKGVDILLKSYRQAFTNEDDVCLVIKDFGIKSPYAGQTQKKAIEEAQKDPFGPQILYIEQDMTTEEIASLYTAVNCLVYPYRGEGFALPVLEAMACGIPVVVTAGGATDDFVTEDCGWFIPAKKVSLGPNLGSIDLIKDGWILEPDAQALAMQMAWLTEHPNACKIKGEYAAKYAHKYWKWQDAAHIAVSRLKALVH